MYGNAQLGLVIHDIAALWDGKDKKKMQLCIFIHGLLSLLHVLMVNYLWDYFKPYPYPETPRQGLRPGGKLWYAEVALCLVYMVIK